MTIKNREYIKDLGSDEVDLILEQLNRLTEFVQQLKDEADSAGTGDAWRTAVAGLAEPDFENLVPDRNPPNYRRRPKE